MTESYESSIPRPSVEGAPAALSSTGSSSMVRKRVIMTKKFWSAEDIRRLFRTLDQDSSGRLSYEEFASGLKELGFEMKEDAVKALYRKMDVDGDGKITEEEFVKLMRNMNREKLSETLSTQSSAKKPKAVNVTVVDLGYTDGTGQYQEYKYTRQDVHSKFVHNPTDWKKHCRWIDIYGTDPAILDLIGNECELSNRMMDESTIKHAGKVQYYSDEKALLLAVHALFLTKRAIQMRPTRLRAASSIAALFSRQGPTSQEIPLQRRRSGSLEKKHFEGDEDDEAEDDEEAEERKEELETDFELMPERFYEEPKVNMSQIIIIATTNTIITVRRRSNNTNIANIFDPVREDIKNFLKSEIRSSLEAPTPRDLLLTFLNELHEHNYALRTSLNEWKLTLEKDINANLNKYQARHLLDLNRTLSKSVQIIEPFVDDFVALTAGEDAVAEQSSDAKSKLTRQVSQPTTGDEKKSYRKDLKSALQFIGDKKQAFSDSGEASKRLLSQFKYGLESAEQLGTYYKHQIDDRQSKALTYLTVISGTIFPLQIFTGVYGMNFDVLPELHWEYSYLLFWIFNLFFMALLLKFWHSRGFF